MHYYNARWYDSSLGRFAQADTIVPGGVQGYDRYVYVNNNPVKYIDPSGHEPKYGPGACYQSVGNTCLNSNGTGITTGNGQGGAPVLNAGGLAAFTGLQILGLLGDEQGAMEFVVDTEFAGTIQSPEAVWPLNKAMTRLYYSYCGSGAWSASCLNGFWGYMQGTLEAAHDPALPLSKMSHNANVPIIAGAILGNSTGLEGWGFTSDLYSGGCQDIQAQVLCGWAVINSTNNQNYYNSIKPPQGEGVLSPYLDPDTFFRDVLIVDNSHLLVVLSPYQQVQDYFNFGNGDFDYNITKFK